MRVVARAWNLALEAVLLLLLVGVLVFTLAPGRRIPETPDMANQKPTLGRIVLYSFLDKEGKIVERPAEIVAVWKSENGSSNLHVKLDGTNDFGLVGVTEKDIERLAFWATSILPADDQEVPQVGRYRWPPRVK